MSDLPQLLERNQAFAERFDEGHLAIRPGLSAVVLTCLDARVDPAHIFDLRLGDALVIRNAGGRINTGVIRDLAVLGVLAAGVPGGDTFRQELVIVQHTDCGMSRLADPTAQETLANRLGIKLDEVAFTMAITDPTKSVEDDIARLRDTPGVPSALIVSGLVYDVTDGSIEQIIPPAPLRTEAGAAASPGARSITRPYTETK